MSRPLVRVLLVILVLVELAWGAAYIQRTSFLVEGSRVYCLWDDAMISMQYARNLAQGHGLVWNAGGERVQGITNLGIALVMAALHLLPISAEKISLLFQGLTLAMLGVLQWLLFGLSQRLFGGEGWTGLAAVLGVMLSGTLAVWTLQGSDVGFVALWLLACLSWMARLGPARALPPGWFVLLGAGLLIRPDVVIFQGLFLACAPFLRGNTLRRTLLGGLIVAGIAAAIIGWNAFYYGDPLPNTVYLKATGSPLALVLVSGLSQLSVWVPGGFALLFLAALAAARYRGDPRVLLCAALCAVTFAYHVAVGGDWAANRGSRFIAPTLPLLCMLAAGALASLLEGFGRGLARPLLLAGVGAAALFANPAVVNREWLDPRAPTMLRQFNEKHVRQAGYLRRHTRPDTSVAVHWGGVPVYFSGRHAIDVFGKSDRHIARLEVTRFIPGHSKWDWDYVVNQRRPDLFLGQSRGLAQRADFRRDYYRVDRNGESPLFLRRESVAKLNDPAARLFDLTTREHVLRPGQEGAPDPTAREPSRAGRWRAFLTHRFDASLSEDQRARIEELEAIGYLQGSRRVLGEGGVTLHQGDRVQPGLNLYTSGHRPEAILMDMEGRVLHRWQADFWKIWPDYPVTRGVSDTGYFRRAVPLENGDLLAIFEGLGLIKLDADSKLLWARPNRAHHDLEVLANGDIVVLTREAHIVPRISRSQPILEDFISVLDAEGREKQRVSLLEAFERSEHEMWKERPRPTGDIFHTNTVSVLDGGIAGEHPAFRRGNVLTSMRYLDALAVVDLEQGKVVWARRGDFRQQHDPKILANGHLMLFDNEGLAGESRVREYASVEGEPVWEYRGTPEQPFYSETCGTAERLPNGNTLVTESDAGRAFEVDAQGERVWEFFNPHRAGKHGQYIATLFEMLRLPPDFPTDWAKPDPVTPVSARRDGRGE